MKSTVVLADIADILVPHPTREQGLVLSISRWTFPTDISACETRPRTSCLLQKGDLLISRIGQVYLVYAQPSVPVYAPPQSFVVRVKDEAFCAEYLYAYLKSDPIRAMLLPDGGATRSLLPRRALLTLPVAAQEHPHGHYITAFYTENFPLSFLLDNPCVPMQVCVNPPRDDRPTVFISYSTADQRIAEDIRAALEQHGILSWMAPYSIPAGSDYAEEIVNAIRACPVFLLLLSQHAFDSAYVKKELNVAVDARSAILPLRLDDCPLPNGFYLLLSDCQMLPLKDSVAQTVDALLDRLTALLTP